MTTFCAATCNGKIIFGSDQLMSADGQKIQRHKDSKKFIHVNEVVFAIPGSPLFTHAFKRFLLSCPDVNASTEGDIYDFLCKFHDVLKDENYFYSGSEDEYGFEKSGFEMLIVSKFGIFSTHEHREVVQHSDFFALGSGQDYALGAMKALWPLENNLVELVKSSIDIASHFDIYTGGTTTIIEI